MTGRLEKCLDLLKRVGIKNKRVLDVGCSDGWLCGLIVKEGAASVDGIEPDRSKVIKAQKVVKKAKIIQGSALQLPYQEGVFDVVTIFDVLEHVPVGGEVKAISEIYRVLKKNGVVLLSTPHKSFLATVADPAWYFGHRHYSTKQIKTLFEDQAFKVKELTVAGGIWEIVAMWVLYIFKWVFKRAMPLEEWFDQKRRLEFRKKGFVEIFAVAEKN